MVRLLSALMGLVILQTAAVLSSQAQECTLECPIDAPCQIGSANLAAHTISLGEGAPSNTNGMHCACPYGWTGVLCDHKYESCDEGHKCYHGGECVPGMKDKFGNDQLFCDCINAEESDGTRYVGKYCETPFEKLCDADGNSFCVNGGDCNPSFPTYDPNPCICPDGWEGTHCEFKRGSVPDCTLDCQNDGLCVVGIRDPSEAKTMRHVWSQQEIDDHMQCLCTQDFGGPLCEASAEDCGGDTCYHGGSCVETKYTNSMGVSTQEYHCDCTTAADQDKLFAGKYCQYPSERSCSDSNENLWCTNGGTCSADSTKGCDCPPGYKGFKCEYRDESYFDNNDKDMDHFEKCGDVYCFNGGECVTTTLRLTDGSIEAQQSCDCTHTFDGVHYWVGSSCQYKSTSTCGNTDKMFCAHQGECPTLENDRSCKCPDGWEGDHCEIHIYALEDEYPNDPTCGEKVCLNGGSCVETRVIRGANTLSEFHCDCSTAFDDNFHFAGESCQYPSTQTCTHDGDSMEGRKFCTNFGTCQDDPNAGCKCPAGFKGFSCEFEDLVNDPVIENQPDGYETCGDDLVCHNGGTCVTSLFYAEDGTSSESKHCDCSTAITETTAWAGKMCEFEASKFCTKPLEGMGLESTYYCVNNGDCNPNDVRQGCDCKAGFTGFRCEFLEEASDILDDPANNSNEVACGDLTCYNGGKCETIDTTDTNTGETSILYECNCVGATDGSYFFAGPECNYQSSDICSQDNPAGMFCVNGGQCDGIDNCKCPSGWTGSMCDVLVKDDQHADQGEKCGEGYCYNGGQCVQTQINMPGGNTVTEYHCDCASAFDDTHRYGGISCEHKSTSFCSRSNQGDSLASVVFCANNGKCDDENPDRGCNCKPGWTGLACEFRDEPDGEAEDNGADNAEPCGDLACFNGGQCVSTTITDASGQKKDMNHCDCSSAFTDTDTFAGAQCEYKQTTFCSEPAQGEDLSAVQYCTNNGSCRENILSGCDCPDAFFGFRCEYASDATELVDKADDPLIVDEYVECGDDYCYNGATCETFVLGNGQSDYRCNCDTAATGSSLFAGKNCQYEMTSLCTSGTLDSLSTADFCVNNGKCPEGDDDVGCSCPSGYTGYRCDEPIYANEDNEDNVIPNDPEEREDDTDFYRCKLDCKNGGQCAKGAKDLSHLDGAVDHVAHLNQTYDERYFEHCECEEGWFGLECEHKAEVCGADEHLCLHGSKCVKNNQQHGCDCSQADEALGVKDSSLFAGDSCQHPATDICTYGNNVPGRPLYFCTNQGTCNDYVSPSDPNPGCSCPPEWTGPHCEMRFDAQISEDTKSPASNSNVAMGLAIAFLIMGIMAFTYIFMNKRPRDPSSTCMPFRRRKTHSGFDPDDDSNNIAPKRSAFASPSNDMNPPPSRTFALRSGSDPMSAFQLDPDDEPEQFRDDPRSSYRDEPTSGYRDTQYQDDPDDEPDSPVFVDVGPSRDEDGNQLNDVEFI